MLTNRQDESGKIYDLTNNYLRELKDLLNENEHVPAGVVIKQYISKEATYITHVEIKATYDPDQVILHSPRVMA